MVNPTWWLIPLSKWVITPILSGLTLIIPFITGVITLSGMNHQVVITRLGPTHNLGHLWVPRASHYHDIRFPICPGGARWLSVMKQLYALVLLPPGTSGCPELGFRVFKKCWGHGDFTDLNCLPKPTKMEKYGVHHQKLMGNLGLKQQQQGEHRDLHSKDGHVLGRETMAKKPDGL